MEEEDATGAATTTTEKRKEKEKMSYRYWVRSDIKDEAKAPPPLPCKIITSPSQNNTNINTNTNTNTNTVGSIWNSAGTWEEKSLYKWAHARLQELLLSVTSLHFSSGKAHISQLTKCEGDAFQITVRNKKRVGYNFELTLLVKGEWTLNQQNTPLNCYLDIPDFSFGELDDLQMQVRINDDKVLVNEDKMQIIQDLNQFLNLIREKLVQFENEIKER